MCEHPLEINGLGHDYDGTSVLSCIDLTLRPGELMSLLGASGAGKTTVLRCIAGLTTPTRGRISIGGRVVAQQGVNRVAVEERRVGLVFQEYALFPFMTVRQNVAFGSDDQARVDQLLSLVGLDKLAERRPAQLSGGQQQRVALARALAPKPHLLLLDEPFANIDASLKEEVGAELVEILHSQGASALLVTHDQRDALSYTDRLAVLVAGDFGGKIDQVGAPKEVYKRPSSKEVARILGPATFVKGRALGRTAETAFGQIPIEGESEGTVDVVVRPEDGRFVADENGAVQVKARRYLGRGYRLQLVRGDDVLMVDAEGPSPTVGARGRIAFDHECWALERSSPSVS